MSTWAHGRPVHGCYAMNWVYTQCTPAGARLVHPNRHAHYHHCDLRMSCPSPTCLGPGSALNLLSPLMSLSSNYILSPSLHKKKNKTKLMNYKYIMRSSEQRFIISLFSIFITDVFSKSIFLKYHCIFSL
jgi:hypothetical protein